MEESRPLEEILESLLKASPALSKLFLPGSRILKPFKKGLTSGKHGEEDEGPAGDKPFVGKPHPSYFKFPKKEYGEILPRSFEVGRRCRLAFETDVDNEYFSRAVNPGRFHVEVLEPCGIHEPNWSLTLHAGIAALSMVMPEDFVIGDRMTLQFTVEDDVLIQPFVNVAKLTAKTSSDHPSGKGEPREGKGRGGDSTGPTGIALPDIIPVTEKDWGQYKFDRYSACAIVQDPSARDEDESVYTFYVNVDNVHLLAEIKVGGEDPRLPRTKFIFGNVLVGLALIQYSRDREQSRAKDEDGNGNGNGSGSQKLPEDLTVELFVREATRALSPFMLPMIDRLGALSEDEVGSLGVIGDDE